MNVQKSLEALQDRDFRWFFTARSVSRVGSSMAPVALVFAILHVEQKASAIGLIMAGRTAAMVVFLLLGGVIADRFPRRLIIQLSHAATALTQGTVAWLVLSGHATILSIFVIECLNGAVSAFTMPSMQGLVPQLVRPRLLQQANALMSFSNNGTTIIGPVLAGILVAGPGAGWALAIDAATYVVAIVALAQIALPEAVRSTSSLVRDLRDGWGEFTARTWLWVVVIAFGMLNAIHAGAWLVLGPFVAKTDPSLGVRGWSYVLSAEAIGSVLMTLVLMRRNLRHPLRAGMIGISLLAAPILMLGLEPVTLPLIAMALVAGAGSEVFGTGWNVAMMENVPVHAQSRVWSYDMLGSIVAVPVGTVLYGWLAITVAPSRLLIGSGVAYGVITLAVLLVPSVRSLGRVAVVDERDEPVALPVDGDIPQASSAEG